MRVTLRPTASCRPILSSPAQPVAIHPFSVIVRQSRTTSVHDPDHHSSYLALPYAETAQKDSSHQAHPVVRSLPPLVFAPPAVRRIQPLSDPERGPAGRSRPCYLFVLAPLCEHRPRFVAFRPSPSRIPKPCNRAGKSALQRIHKRSDGRRAQLLKNVHKFNYEL